MVNVTLIHLASLHCQHSQVTIHIFLIGTLKKDKQSISPRDSLRAVCANRAAAFIASRSYYLLVRDGCFKSDINAVMLQADYCLGQSTFSCYSVPVRRRQSFLDQNDINWARIMLQIIKATGPARSHFIRHFILDVD